MLNTAVPCHREVVSFLGWLHAHNATIPAAEVRPPAAACSMPHAQELQ